MRLGSISGEVYNIRHGTIKEPLSLPYKLIMFINKNFNNLYEVNRFFAPVNKQENKSKFLKMLNEIAPFKASEILFEGSCFNMPNKIYTVMETSYDD
jgi:hypothetical protein